VLLPTLPALELLVLELELELELEPELELVLVFPARTPERAELEASTESSAANWFSRLVCSAAIFACIWVIWFLL